VAVSASTSDTSKAATLSPPRAVRVAPSAHHVAAPWAVRAVDRAVVCERMRVDIAIMQALGFALALSPLSGVLVFLSITIRRQWRQSPLVAPLEPLRPSEPDDGPWIRSTGASPPVRAQRRGLGRISAVSRGTRCGRPTDRAEARADRIEVASRGRCPRIARGRGKGP